MAKRRRPRKGKDRPRKRKLSVMVLHRTKDTMELMSSIKVYKSQLVAALAERYAPKLLAGESLPDWDQAITLVGRDVQTAMGCLIELDDRVDDAEIEHEEVRLKRLRLVRDELCPQLVMVRGAIDLAFGRKQGRLLHAIKGRTPRQPELLERQLRLTMNRLANKDFATPEPKNRHAIVDREGWSEQLRAGHRELAQLNRQRLRGEKNLDFLYLDKQNAMAAFDTSYGDALRYLQALLRMSGLDARIMKNLRPYYMRRRLKERARRQQEARAAKAEASSSAEPARVQVSERVEVPKPVVEWLEKVQRFGT